jgi:NhaP-type Na+/H+ or K+/H+ antiporter
MHPKSLFSIFFFLVVVIAFSQSTNKLPVMPGALKKGIITLNDGTAFDFRQLQFKNDSVFYQDYNLNLQEMALHDVYQISKTASYAGIGALSGGGLGLLLGIGLAKTLDDTGDFLTTIFSWGEETDLDTRQEQIRTILLTAIIGTGVGALGGALFPRNKIVFSKSFGIISFNPSLQLNSQSIPVIGLSCRINLQ